MKLFFAFVFVCAMAVVSIHAQTEDDAWKEYKKTYGKNYNKLADGGKEDKIRKGRFLARDAKIKKHNSGKPTYLQAHNRFSDMADDELAQYHGAKEAPTSFAKPTKSVQLADCPIPTSLDYRNDTCLSAVRDQDSCGSCWAFSAIAPLEFSYCKKYGKTLTMSEQHLVDCDNNDGSCRGGWYTGAWEYLRRAGGSAKQSLYSYTGVLHWPLLVQQATCKYTTSMLAAKVSSYGYVTTTKNITQIQSALVEYGPLSIGINAINSFHYYASGVYTDTACDNAVKENHAVVLVGWGNLNGVNYWIVRNSWGTGWGLKGYALIQRGVNKCNIESRSAYVVVA